MSPAVELMITTVPALVSRSGSSALVTRSVPSTFTSYIHCQSSTGRGLDRVEAVGTAGVVDQYGHRRAERPDRRGERFDIGVGSDVAGHRGDFGSGRGQFLGQFGQPVGPARGGHHVESLSGQPAGGCRADTAGGAGHHRDRPYR